MHGLELRLFSKAQLTSPFQTYFVTQINESWDNRMPDWAQFPGRYLQLPLYLSMNNAAETWPNWALICRQTFEV